MIRSSLDSSSARSIIGRPRIASPKDRPAAGRERTTGRGLSSPACRFPHRSLVLVLSARMDSITSYQTAHGAPVTTPVTFYRTLTAHRERARGGPGPFLLGFLLRLLHQADGLDGLGLGRIHVAGLASSLSLADQLGRVGAAALRASDGPRGLHVLGAAARS